MSTDLPGAHLVEALVDGAPGDTASLLGLLERHALAPAAVARLAEARRPALAGDERWLRAVAANRDKGERLARAAALAEAALAPVGDRVAIPPSMLGPLWSSDVDVLVEPGALAEAQRLLEAAGHVPLDALLARLGRETAGVSRFGAVDGTEVLGSIELCLALTDGGAAAAPAIARAQRPPGASIRRLHADDAARRRAAKLSAARVTPLRGALELLALDAAAGLPGEPVVAVALQRAAELERELAGPGRLSELAARHPAPRNREWAHARARGVRREALRRVRPRRLRVAFSGIDGSGKSTQADVLTDRLGRVSIPATAVWVRLGFGGSPLLERAASLGQRILPKGSHSAQRARATGAAPAAASGGGAVPLTRRGPIGWAWTMAVTLDYVRRPRKPVRRARGAVVVHDRALPDALIGLEEGYGGALDLRAHRRIVERFGPRPDITFYLRLSGAASYARKADLFTQEVLEDHARRYDEAFAGLDGVVTLDAEQAPDVLALEALRRVANDDRPARAGRSKSEAW